MAYFRMYGSNIIVPQTKTMTVILDLNNSDPTTWATYANDAVGMTAGSDAWDTFFGHYPCILENGVELGKLKRNNFAQYEDGTGAPITTLGKDVMICFPRRGIKIEYTDSSHLSVSMTDEEDKLGYSYMAHSYKGNACDKIYYGAYKGYGSGSRLYSSSGKTPTVNKTIGTFRSWAQARGTGYEQSSWYPLILRQVMYLLKYKGQNPEIAIGKGYSQNKTAMYGNTGSTNTRGMDWGESVGDYPMCLFGLEDFYGNIFEMIEGVFLESSREYIKVSDGNYNDNGNGYYHVNTRITRGYLRFPMGGNYGFFPKYGEPFASATTYFCDNVGIEGGNMMCCYGGYWGASGTDLGVFKLNGSVGTSSSWATVGSRLMYMHVA